MMDNRFRPLGVDAAYRPARRKPMISQIEISPQINAPINIGLGSLPIVIGSFAGAVVMFVLGGQAPSLKPFTLVAGLGLAAFGAFNLFTRDAAAETIPGGEELPGTASPAGGGDASVSPSIAPTSEEAFPLISGRVMSPSDFQTIDQSPFSNAVPVRVRLTNPSSSPVTFDMVIESNEIPSPFGGDVTNSESTRVSLGAGETRDIDVTIMLTTWGWSVDTVDVYLTVLKRRISGGSQAVLAATHFVVD